MARQRFHRRAQHESETVDEYVAALGVLVADCNFGSLTDRMLRDQPVSKTTNKHLCDRLLYEGSSLMLLQAIMLANLYEQAVSQANEFRDDGSVHHVKKIKGFHHS